MLVTYMVYPFQILGDHFNYNVGGARWSRVSGSGVESEKRARPQA